MPITSMYKAFVSSTFEDLGEHRAHVIRSLRSAGIFIESNEDWTDRTTEPDVFDESRIRGCDLCVLLLAFRRGVTTDGSDKSIIQLEYYAALKNGIDVIVFLLDENAPWPRRFDELDKDPQLGAWRKELSRGKYCYSFSLDPLSIHIDLAVTRWISEKKGSVIVEIENGKRATAVFPEAITAKIPGRRAANFIGRKNDLETLRRLLLDKNQVVLTSGSGGVGKTTLAQMYVGEFRDKYSHIAWISGVTGDIARNFVITEGLMGRMGIASEGRNTEELFSAITARMKDIDSGPNLLVIENADALQVQKICLQNWHVLVTSKSGAEDFENLSIGCLSEADAVALFLKHCPHCRQSPERIQAVVKQVEYHTLAIEVLAKTVRMQQLEIGNIEKVIYDDVRSDVFITHAGEKKERAISYLCSIFMSSFLGDDEIGLLKRFVFLPDDFHPYGICKLLLAPGGQADGYSFDATLDLLDSKGWLSYDRENNCCRMHRIVANVILKLCDVGLEDAMPVIKAVTGMLELDGTSGNIARNFQWIAFADSILSIVGDDEGDAICGLLSNYALVLKELGDYLAAKELLERAVKADEKKLRSDQQSIAVRYDNLAQILFELGDYEGSKTYFEKAIKLDEKHLGREHPVTAGCYTRLALTCKNLGDYAEAKRLLKKALVSNEKNYGADHPAVANCYSSLALVYKAIGDYDGAKLFFEKALRSDEKNFGPDHPATAVHYSNLAAVLKITGDYAGARTYLEKALLSDEKNMGSDHPATAVRYSNLALMLRALGDYAGAFKLSEKSVAIMRKTLPAEHPNVKTVIEINQSIRQSLATWESQH